MNFPRWVLGLAVLAAIATATVLLSPKFAGRSRAPARERLALAIFSAGVGASLLLSYALWRAFVRDLLR